MAFFKNAVKAMMLYFFIFGISCDTPNEIKKTKTGVPDDWGPTGVLRTGSASSQFREGALDYKARYAADGDPKTGWCAQKGDSEAWIRMQSPCAGPLFGLVFRNGMTENSIMFSSRDRIQQANVLLRVDGVEVWRNRIELQDTIQPQHLDIPDVVCSQEYTIQLDIKSRYENVGLVCLSEMQAMIDAATPISIVHGKNHESREVPAKLSLKIYAGPSTEYTLLGYAPILLTRYGAPYLRVVEERGDFVRFDRLRRRFEPKEVPPTLDDPTYGGWVHRDHLAWDQAFP